jgi:hypothetical protein
MNKYQLILILMACCLFSACTLSQPSQNMKPTQEKTKSPATIESVPSDTPAPTGTITFFWPLDLPEGFIFSRENSHADADSFKLVFMDTSQGIVLRLLGGTEADQYKYCVSYENNPSEPVTVRGLEGCFPATTGSGFAVEWKENGTHYIVGGMSVSKQLALDTAEHLESIDLSTFLTRLVP